MDEPKTWAEVSERLERAPRGSKLRLAGRLEMDPSFLNRKLKGGRPLTVHEAEVIAGFLTAPANDAEPAPTGRRVPVYGYAAMGASTAEDDVEGDDVIAIGSSDVIDWMELPAGLNPRGEAFVIQTIGSSMEPRIFPGEPLLVLVRVPPTRDGDALIEFHDGTGVVKSYRGARGGRVWARQYNPDRPRDYDAARVKAVHRVIRL